MSSSIFWFTFYLWGFRVSSLLLLLLLLLSFFFFFFFFFSFLFFFFFFFLFVFSCFRNYNIILLSGVKNATTSRLKNVNSSDDIIKQASKLSKFLKKGKISRQMLTEIWKRYIFDDYHINSLNSSFLFQWHSRTRKWLA